MRTEMSRLIVLVISTFTMHIAALPQFASQIRPRSGVPLPSVLRFESRASIKLPINSTAILNAIPTSFNLAPAISVGRKIIPDAAHPFIAPGPTDVRGGCPGLNLLANYGFLPRNGITDMTTLLYAAEEGFGFSTDLASILVAFALKTCVDLTTLKMSIGDTDARTDGPLTFLLGRAPGLFSPTTHNEYETTDDAYFAGGQTDQFNGSRWRTWYQLAGLIPCLRFDIIKYNLCRNSNPQCHWAVVDQIAFYIAQCLVPTIMPSAGADGLPGPALSDSINQFMGIVKQSDGTFTRGHSHFPPGPEGVWYRRTIPLTTAELAVAGALSLTSLCLNLALMMEHSGIGMLTQLNCQT
ncbi:uncharacterized protein MELLADRAFT_94316 [Melampsora larici-populina 98AG31]|uniref:Heme haloperoxidase family profile domain-containing protein n=1 Tax=Melampsora larici-populina (strain 98AG31 / pathotype 3-4-7) TaxID=747676 RepID=F4S7A1_MELLP|nr:uncharacterized protein MELLADRAFT_94316 [Melampsora larici-populina 98AG31]EGF99480.1 hypothetical protein MELLADRAFT_94316 [Melampsora larici-populina 98AG31]